MILRRFITFFSFSFDLNLFACLLFSFFFPRPLFHTTSLMSQVSPPPLFSCFFFSFFFCPPLCLHVFLADGSTALYRPLPLSPARSSASPIMAVRRRQQQAEQKKKRNKKRVQQQKRHHRAGLSPCKKAQKRKRDVDNRHRVNAAKAKKKVKEKKEREGRLPSGPLSTLQEK